MTAARARRGSASASGQHGVLTREGLQRLFDVLRADGYKLLGPTVRDEAIVYGPLSRLSDLPEGWTDIQDAGRYRLERRGDAALFGYNVGPHSWKRYLHPPLQRLWTASRAAQGYSVAGESAPIQKRAFIGVRACELRAIAIQDRVFLGGPYRNPHYAARREQALLIAVNCAQAADTCFCVSMGTGPGVSTGFDLALTELMGPGRQEFLVQTGSKAGRRLLGRIPTAAASRQHVAQAQGIVAGTAGGMRRRLNTDGLKTLLQQNPEHPRWANVAQRCLSCGNCTMVCPTCYCTTVEDRSDLEGACAERLSRWDSCFSMDFSYIHGGSVRNTTRSRYRHWMTHKLASWHDQFGESGCVGCGRCITWCPVGIDITEEAAAIRANPQPARETPSERP